MDRASDDQNCGMKNCLQALLFIGFAAALSACANTPSKESGPPKKLKLETIDHGPMRPKTYLYREVEDPAPR